MAFLAAGAPEARHTCVPTDINSPSQGNSLLHNQLQSVCI